MTGKHQQRHETDGYTVGVYFPPAAPWDVIEAFLDRVAEDAHSIERADWDAFVVGRAGDQLHIDSEETQR